MEMESAMENLMILCNNEGETQFSNFLQIIFSNEITFFFPMFLNVSI